MNKTSSHHGLVGAAQSLCETVLYVKIQLPILGLTAGFNFLSHWRDWPELIMDQPLGFCLGILLALSSVAYVSLGLYVVILFGISYPLHYFHLMSDNALRILTWPFT